MTKNQNLELFKWIDQTIDNGSDSYTAEYRRLAESSSEADHEKCFLLSSRLRKRGFTSDAYSASELLTSLHPSLKSYNIYLISAYDLTYKGNLSTSDLYKVFQETWDFYQPLSYEPNITSTLLKCCNYLIQNGLSTLSDLFYAIYEKCPIDQRNQNSFIIAQYFKRLIAEEKEQQVFSEFNKLPLNLQANRTLSDIVNRCTANAQRIKPTSQSTSKKLTIISTEKELTDLTDILNSFSLELTQVNITSNSLAEDLNQNTYKSGKALVVIPENTTDIDCLLLQRYAFALGYCIHKFGKGNTILFLNKNLQIEENSILKLYNPISFESQVDFIKQLGIHGLISG